MENRRRGAHHVRRGFISSLTDFCSGDAYSCACHPGFLKESLQKQADLEVTCVLLQKEKQSPCESPPHSPLTPQASRVMDGDSHSLVVYIKSPGVHPSCLSMLGTQAFRVHHSCPSLQGPKNLPNTLHILSSLI